MFYRTGFARQVRVCLFAVVEDRRQNEGRPDEPFLSRCFYLGQQLFKISARFRPEQRRCDTYKRARKEAGDIVLSWPECPGRDTYEWHGICFSRRDGLQRAVRAGGNCRVGRSFRRQHNEHHMRIRLAHRSRHLVCVMQFAGTGMQTRV